MSKEFEKGKQLAKEDKRKAEEIKPTQKQTESARKTYEEIQNDDST